MNAPDRIVSLLSSATEMLYLLGLGERVVAVSHECDYPRDVCGKPRATKSNIDSTAASRSIDEQVKSLLADGQPLYSIDVAQLVALKPEMIVTQAQCDVCAVRYDEVLAAVRDQPNLQGVTVIALNPSSLDDVLSDIQRLAEAAGVDESGTHIVAELRGRVRIVQDATKPIPADQRPRVACIEWTDPLMLAANWMPELVQIAGGRHDLTQAGIHSGYSSWDDLMRYDPQVIVVMPCGFDLDRSVIESKRLMERPEWLQLDAVLRDRVFAVDANAYFNRSGPRLVESLELLAHVLHPERFHLPSSVDADRALRRIHHEDLSQGIQHRRSKN